MLAQAAIPVLLVTLQSLESGGDPFGECRPALEAHRNVEAEEGWRRYQCFFAVGRRTEDWDGATAELSKLGAVFSADPWIGFYLASIAQNQGRAEAAALFRDAAVRFQAARLPRGEFYCHNNLSSLLLESQRYDEAEAAVVRVEELAQQIGDPGLQSEAKLVRARLLARSGRDYDGALQLLREIEASHTEETNFFSRFQLQMLLGNLFFNLSRFDEAEIHHRRARATAQDVDPAATTTATINLLLNQLARVPKPGAREEALRRAREVEALTAEEHPSKAIVHVELGRLTGGEEGQRILAEGVRFARASESLMPLEIALKSHALAVVDDQPEEAARQINEADELTGGTDSAYGGWLRLKYLWRALPRAEALEAARQILRKAEEARQRQGSDRMQVEVFARWTGDYQWVAGQLFAEAEGAAEATRHELLSEALEMTEHMRTRGMAASGGEEVELPGLQDLQGELAEDEALLLFQLAPWVDVYGDDAGGAWLLVLTRNRERLYRLPGQEELERRIRGFAGRFADPGVTDAEPASFQLYEELLAGALNEMPPSVHRLVLVPDRTLHTLPFPVLRPSADDPPLAARYRLTFAPSATLWRQLRQGDSSSASGVAALVFGDPGAGSAGDRAMQRLRQKLGPLPRARREVRLIARRLGDGAMSKLGDEASESALKATAPDSYTLLHFATHASVDEHAPERSALVLAPGGEEDGLLRAPEIAELDLRGKVVILSACQGASGRVVGGEGPMSLARAFFRAGAQSVVASLWPLEDRAAERFFRRLYNHLSQGASLDEAVQAVQSEGIASGWPVTHWAGIQVLGNGSVRPLPGVDPRAAPVTLFAGLVTVIALGVIATVVWYLRRTRRATR